MGNQPSFPTNEQWDNWKKREDDKFDEFTKNTQSNINSFNDEVDHLALLYTNYTSACYDKSFFRRTFYDNNECSHARNELVVSTIKLGKYANENQELATLKNKLNY